MASEKISTSRMVAIVIAVALVAGYAISGNFLYHAVIGLDATAFPAGEWIQRTFGPDMSNAIAGIVLGLGTLLLIPLIAIGFVFSRTSHASGEANRGRRRFLTTSLAGFGALVAAVVGSLAHALFGVGKEGDGWYDISGKISSDDGVVKTHPTWDDAWKTAQIRSYGRLGRTGSENRVQLFQRLVVISGQVIATAGHQLRFVRLGRLGESARDGRKDGRRLGKLLLHREAVSLPHQGKGKRHSRFKADNPVGGQIELNILFQNTVRGMVRGNNIDSAVPQAFPDCLDIIAGPQGRIHLCVGVIKIHGILGQ